MEEIAIYLGCMEGATSGEALLLAASHRIAGPKSTPFIVNSYPVTKIVAAVLIGRRLNRIPKAPSMEIPANAIDSSCVARGSPARKVSQ